MQGLEAVVMEGGRRCINGWNVATHCGLSYGSRERCPPSGIRIATPCCKPNHGQVLEAAEGGLEFPGLPLPTGNEVRLQTHSPWGGQVSC